MKGLFIDLDGVIYQGGKPIPRAIETLSWVAEQGIPHLFVTNTSSGPRQGVVDRLAGMGISVSAEHILTPAIAAHQWIKTHRACPVSLFVVDATTEDLGAFPSAAPGEAVKTVVIGDMGQAWDFDRLNGAFRLLMADPHTQLLALGTTRYWQASDGLRLDVGPFVKALEYASGKEAIVIGKPAKAFFEQALAILGLADHEVVMIGDDIRGDVQGGQLAGLKAIQVKTGKFRPGDLGGTIQPDWVIDSIADLPGLWSSL